MSTAQLIEKIERLPENLKKEVEEFVDEKEGGALVEQSKDYSIKLGLLKGKIHIAKDFDEPLEDFADYM